MSAKIAPVEWAQRQDLVYVHFMVQDCENPTVKVEKSKLQYSGTSTDGSKYENTLELFGEVDVDKSKWHNHARGAEFVLIKANADGPYWPRLLKDNAKHHWLKVDFNKWVDEDESADEGTGGDMMGGGAGGGGGNFEEMMRQMGGLGGLGGMGGMGGDGGAPFNMLDDLNPGDEGDDAEDDDEDLPPLEDPSK